jgi:hypothetical protein
MCGRCETTVEKPARKAKGCEKAVNNIPLPNWINVNYL